jgi:hypothetical protein
MEFLMDPTQAATQVIIAPWTQYGVVGAVVVALGGVVVMLWRALSARTEAHLATIEKCHEQTLDVTLKQTEANNKMAGALEGLERVIDTLTQAVAKSGR